MHTLLIFDKDFKVDREVLTNFLNDHCSYLKFSLSDDVTIESDILSKPKSFNSVLKQLDKPFGKVDRVFCFTNKPYIDNYFLHEDKLLSIITCYGWPHLTNLPYSNGIVYFVVYYFALVLDNSDFRHQLTTGCIYDFLWSKAGIDDSMRQAKFCTSCLKRVTKNPKTDQQKPLFDDLKVLMNQLSNSSKWNLDVLSSFIQQKVKVAKRKCKVDGQVNVVIASPGDTQSERSLLLDKLEIQFRRGNHEKHCNRRLIVHGWEDLATQPGYPQDIINERIIQQMDFVIAIFKHKLGTPTIDITTNNIRAASGTVEELLQAIDNVKKSAPLGMAYFYSKAPSVSLDTPDFETIRDNWIKLEAFKKVIQNKMIYKPYAENNSLLDVVILDLEKNILDHFE
jgi:hypothetical protein